MADTLSVLKYYLYYKYKKRFSEAPWNGGRYKKSGSIWSMWGSIPGFTRE